MQCPCGDACSCNDQCNDDWSQAHDLAACTAWASLMQQHHEGGHDDAVHAACDDDGHDERHNMHMHDGTCMQVMCNVVDHVPMVAEMSPAAMVFCTCQPCFDNRRHGAWHNACKLQ